MEKEISQSLRKIIEGLGLDENPIVAWASESQEKMCDLTTTAALAIWKKVEQNGKAGENGWRGPMDLASFLVGEVEKFEVVSENVEKISVAAPGHINFKLKNEVWKKMLNSWGTSQLIDGSNEILNGKKIMVEYGHPNTHKEMHVGHLRTLITGESLARIAKKLGADVLRANYQGDIGPHVAKALYGVMALMQENNLAIEELEGRSLIEKAKFLGEGYVRGNQDYEKEKEQIDAINKQLYSKDEHIYDLYTKTRKWSLDYFEDIYGKLGTHYDKYYFETEVAEAGMEIVKNNVGNVFEDDGGTIVFRGENYGLHTRVFVTGQGTPTYEAKELALAMKQFGDFAFDLNLHIVANEQAEYFKVLFKALEKLNPDLAGREKHVSMGMVNLIGMKISSRTGVVVTVNQILESVENAVDELMANSKSGGENQKSAQTLALGALKFAMLKQSTAMNVAFDIKQSVALLGFTGPYLQYTHARCQSVLRKGEVANGELDLGDLMDEERSLIFWLNKYPKAIEKSWETLSPHHVSEYLHELAARFNLLYNNLTILDAEQGKKNLRLRLSQETGKRLAEGLELLGIEAPDQL